MDAVERARMLDPRTEKITIETMIFDRRDFGFEDALHYCVPALEAVHDFVVWASKRRPAPVKGVHEKME